jgi:LPS-assembly protein
VRFDYLHDKEIVTNDAKDPINDTDGLIRTNYERFWLRGMLDGYFEDPRWRFKVDVDVVSDQNYLREFKRGLGGFEDSREKLFDLFGRDLNERDDLRTTQIQVLRDWDRVSLAMLARYDQDPTLEHGNRPYSSNTQPQRLPEANLYLQRGRILEDMPLEAEGSAQLVRFQREKGSRGMRYEIAPRIALPLVSKYGSVIISGGVRHTQYATESRETIASDTGSNRGERRTIPDASVSAVTELAAVYPLAGKTLDARPETAGQTRWNAVQHMVQPRIAYTVSENVDQSNNPYYDLEDRIRPRNDITYSLVNILTRRREVVTLTETEKGTQAAALVDDYLEFLRLTLEQSYNIREARRSHSRDQYSRRPFGDMKAEFTVRPLTYLGLSFKSWWSPYERDFTQHDISLNFTEPNWGYVAIGYNYRGKIREYNRRRDQDIKTIGISGVLDIYGPWQIGGSYKADLHLRKDVERSFRIAYKHDCFTLYGEYAKDYDDERIGISIELIGLSQR